MMKGSCLCGNVRIEVTGPTSFHTYCHCTQCRKQTGHFWATATAPMSAITVTGEVRWYASSTFAKRGFCPTCGSFLFWKANADDEIGFSLGLIDGPTGLTMEKHIFTADKGDYYQIDDGLPQERRENP
jgi:hypothetical protein